jgi:hypothetical protein
MDSDGNTLWGDGSFPGGNPDRNGTVVCNANDGQYYPHICTDGAGGAIIIWEEQRLVTADDIFAQHVDSDGKTHWGDGSFPGGNLDRNGTAICNLLTMQWANDAQETHHPTICSDMSGGAIIAWINETASGWNMAAQRVRARIPSPRAGLPAGDDDDDDDEDTENVVLVVVIIIIACVGGVVVVVIVLIKQGIIGTSRG